MSQSPKPFTFLQMSDIHLDSPLGSKRLALSPAKRLERKGEILKAMLKGFTLAKERNLDAIIIPGDVWDSEAVTSQTINRVIEASEEIPHIPIIIAPGNHDYYSTDSLYNQTVLKARAMRLWPANVQIITSPTFVKLGHPGREDVSFTGSAFLNNVPVTSRLLAGDCPKDNHALYNILLFHGSLDGYNGQDAQRPGKHTAPFSAQELEQLDFSWCAVGHYHDYFEIRAKGNDRLLGAYSGCLVGRGLDEPGPHYALIGELSLGAGNQVECKLERHELDQRKIIALTLNISGMTSTQVLDAISNLLSKCGARTQQDIVYLILEGKYAHGGQPTYVEPRFRDFFWHFVVEDRTRPDYLSQSYDPRTTEGKFIDALLQLRRHAELADAGMDSTSGDYTSAQVIDDALYYGLDALKQNKVELRHVD